MLKQANSEHDEFDIFSLLRFIKAKQKTVVLLSIAFVALLLVYVFCIKPTNYICSARAYSSTIEVSMLEDKINRLEYLISNKAYEDLASYLNINTEEAELIRSIDAAASANSQIQSIQLICEAIDSTLGKKLLFLIQNYVSEDSLFMVLSEERKVAIGEQLAALDRKLNLDTGNVSNQILILDNIAELVNYRSKLKEELKTFNAFKYYNKPVVVSDKWGIIKSIAISIVGGIAFAILFVIAWGVFEELKYMLNSQE